MSEKEVIELLEAACHAAGSQAAWAEAEQISPAYVNDVLHGRRAPGPRILEALGLARDVIYREERCVKAD